MYTDDPLNEEETLEFVNHYMAPIFYVLTPHQTNDYTHLTKNVSRYNLKHDLKSCLLQTINISERMREQILRGVVEPAFNKYD